MESTFKALFEVGKFLLKGYTLKQEKGARFANKSEQKKVFKYANKGLLIDGKDKRISKKDSFEHLCLIAKPGAGKTTGYIIPNVLDKAKFNCSMVITDPSGEIFQNTSAYLKSRGFNILTLQPDNIASSSRFNPFYGVENVIDIEKICTSIIMTKYGTDKEPIWNEGAIGLLEIFAKCLFYSKPDYLNLTNINYLLQMFGEDGSDLDDWVIENSINLNNPDDKSIVNAWIGISGNNKNMLQSFVTIARTALKQLNNSEIQILLSENDIELDSFKKQKTALFIIIPVAQGNYYQFVIDLFYTRFFSQMMKKRPEKKDKSIYCFLDEFGSGYIHDFSGIINNIRKYQVSISIVLQSISQLESKYGKNAEAIKGGIGSYLVLSGADYKTAKEFSDMVGKTITIQRNNFTDIEQRFQELNLINPDGIRTLGDNQAIFVSKNRYPQLIDILPYYKNWTFKSASKKGMTSLKRRSIMHNFKILRL
ncbi:MAG: type IV secretory system conjugative DNA transfer family protein [Gammaproteobacteria bacterium]|nr:type IV secretory system conjugative DNA transfer family protein [Gammaproteobacteria bacterium]